MISKILNKIKKDNFWKNLFSNSFWAFFGDSFASIITLLVTIILIRTIGNSNYGLLVLGQSYMQVMDVLLNIQCWKSVIQYGQKAIVNKRNNDLYAYIRLGCILDISTAIIGGIVSLALASVIGKIFNWQNELILCAQIFSLTIFTHFSGTPTAVLRILNKFKLVAYQKIISSLIKICSLLLIMIYYKKVTLIFAVTVYSITDIIGNLLLILFAGYVFNKEYGIKNLLKKELPTDKKSFISFTLWGTLSEIVDIPVNYFDVFIVSYLGTNLVAVFKVFKQVISILSKLTTPIYQAIMPQFAELTAKGNKKRGYEIVKKIRNVILTIMLPCSFILGITSIIWLDLIYGSIYAENWYILLIYLFVQTLASSYTTIHPYFITLGNAKQSALYVLIANIVYMFLALILANEFGMLGLVISYFIQSSIVISLKIKHIKKNSICDIDHYNEVVIIGGNHHNMLGVVRAFGEKGILSNVIITNANKYCFIKKSKYIKNCDIISENEKDIINLLKQKYSKLNKKAVLIPTSDFAALVIDKNLKSLEKRFIVPNINNRENKIVEYMDKYNQYKIIKESEINIAQSWELNLQSKKIIPNNITYPCILKPLVSAYASKGDITICDDKESLLAALEKYKKLNYSDAILQEYIKFDQEYGLIGCVHNGNIILPGIIKKERIYPQKRGNVSYGVIDKLENSTVNFESLFQLLKKLNYSGMFDIEVFVKDNKFYLNEINFRNSGNSYLYTYCDVYIVYLWYLMVCNENLKNEIKKVNNNYYFTDEILEIKQLLSRNISIQEWNNARKSSKISFLINRRDFVPLVYKFIYAIFRRIDNGK